MSSVREEPMPLYRKMLCVGRCISDYALFLILPSAPTPVTIDVAGSLCLNWVQFWIQRPRLLLLTGSKIR